MLKNFTVSFYNLEKKFDKKIIKKVRDLSDAKVIADSWIFASKIISVKRNEESEEVERIDLRRRKESPCPNHYRWF